MKYYSIIDTNVLVSALLKRGSIPSKILELVFEGVIAPIFSESILREYKTVLNRPKFHFPTELVDNFIIGMEKCSRIIEPKPQKFDKTELPDIGDWKFYELLQYCQKSETTYLVTGNIKHFPDESSIVTPHQMIDIVTHEIK